MLKIRLISNVLKRNRYLSTKIQIQSSNDEFTETPEYPPIVDTSYDARKAKKTQSWHEKIRKINTIEEKLLELNIPRYYGYPCVMLGETFPYNSMPFIQYCTRTEFKENLPDYYSKFAEKSKVFVDLIKSDVEDVLKFEHLDWQYVFLIPS
jgi:small subunit ribosomal protein S30